MAKFSGSDYDYVASKVAHMKRIGVVSQNSTGRGKNGGACPDWQRAEQEAQEATRVLSVRT